MPMNHHHATTSKKERKKQSRQAKPRPPAHPIITATTKQGLHKLDSGRCLITSEKIPAASSQPTHILGTRPKIELDYIAKTWGVSSLDLNSTNNLVTLREDWRLLYNHGDWAFVPSEHILRKILAYNSRSTFDKPYARFDPNELQEYVFVPLPTLRRRYIHRQMARFDEDGDQDDGGDEGGDAGDGRESEEEEFSTYTSPFLDFPALKHHAHPFYVIYTALPKLRDHYAELHLEYRRLFALMNRIEINWIVRSSKRRLSSLDEDEDGGPSRSKPIAKRLKLTGADQTKTRKTRGTPANANNGKAKAKGASKKVSARRRESPHHARSQSADLNHGVFLSDDEIAAWAASVATAGTPELVDEKVVWPDKERVRAPIRKWAEWHVPYKQPKERSKFCTADWPMYLYSYPLWMPYKGK